MRVIAGEKKGRKLNSPKGDLVRPTPDKVKGAMFNIINTNVEGAIILDLFAGSGALGIEALSRGAKKVYFGDYEKSSINLVEKNLKHVELTDNAEVILGDYADVLAQIKESIDFVLLDPPYYKGFYEDLLSVLDKSDIITTNTKILVERDTWNALPDKAGRLIKTDTKKYGKTSVDIYTVE